MAAPAALLFDLDGTLWDSWPWYASVIGRDDQRRREQVLHALERGEAIATLLHKTRIRESDLAGLCVGSEPCELFDGVAEGLVHLSDCGTRLGVVTNLPSWIARPMLQAVRLIDYFHAVVYYERGCAKPSAAPMLKALGGLGIQASESVWYIGDTDSDRRSSVAAGISFAWAAYGYGAVDEYDTAIECFEQVLETVKFLYKIYSRYDGFTPAQIPARLDGKGRLKLGWAKYIEAVENGSQVWVYFHGPHAFENGVYVKRRVKEVDIPNRVVFLKPTERSQERPLTDPKTTRQIAATVAAHGQQVFLLPEELRAPTCLLTTTAASCNQRECHNCETWKKLPRIKPRTLGQPSDLSGIASFVPAYWSIPSRSFILKEARGPRRGIRQTSELFMRFKTGEKNLAYPLARGIYERLGDEKLGQFEAVVPIPLSPDKARAREIHRTRLLAKELALLLRIPEVELLRLKTAISKRRLIATGEGIGTFRDRYRKALSVSRKAQEYNRILLLDDVCTYGSTLSIAASALRKANPQLQIVAVTAAQMVVRAAVNHESSLLERT